LCVFAPVAIAACGDVPRAVPDAHPAADAAPGLRTITVQRSHGGGGAVTSSVGGIACGTTCTASVADGTSVTLTAAADPGSTFTGWSGPCTGSDTTCSFTVSGDATVGAAFDLKRYTVTVALAGPGVGTVTAAPGALSCPGMCSMSVDAGSVITLTATPAAQLQSKFVGWGTPMCSGTAPCVLPINGDQTITAIFTKITCGNGVPEPGEECDDGNTSNNDACTNACTIARCGDGFQWFGHEDCDDGNTSNTDACTSACKMAQCGDGFVWTGQEECDAGTANSNSGACTTSCKQARCGDGFIWAGHEGCDDGAANSNTGACTTACKPAQCGDGFTWTGHEECDDGNTSNTDACINACKAARCGDGFAWAGHERCDDGNLTNNDHCDNSCHCGGPGQVCCDTGSACDTGNGCLQGICSACPAAPVTSTRFSTPDSDGSNCGGVDNVHFLPARCSDGNHREQCIVTPVNPPSDTSCTFAGWINPADPGDCGCKVEFITPHDCNKRINCTITVTQTTNSPPKPDGCP
jgi:cysteine-rich repeat protein